MKPDPGLEHLLDLDGEIVDLGDGFRVTIRARRVPVDSSRPHGIDYSLCLLDPADRRVVCFDNAHPAPAGKGRKRTATRDHVHAGGRVAPYAYSDAGTLLVDFWNAVYAAMRKRSGS